MKVLAFVMLLAALGVPFSETSYAETLQCGPPSAAVWVRVSAIGLRTAPPGFLETLRQRVDAKRLFTSSVGAWELWCVANAGSFPGAALQIQTAFTQLADELFRTPRPIFDVRSMQVIDTAITPRCVDDIVSVAKVP